MLRPQGPERTPSAAQDLLTKYLQGLDNAGPPDRLHASAQANFHTAKALNGQSAGRNQRLIMMGDRRFVQAVRMHSMSV